MVQLKTNSTKLDRAHFANPKVPAMLVFDIDKAPVNDDGGGNLLRYLYIPSGGSD